MDQQKKTFFTEEEKFEIRMKRSQAERFDY